MRAGVPVVLLLLAGCESKLPMRNFLWSGQGTALETLMVHGDFDGKTARRVDCYRKLKLCVEAVGYVADQGYVVLQTEVFFLDRWDTGGVTSDDGRLEVDLMGKKLRLDGQTLRTEYGSR